MLKGRGQPSGSWPLSRQRSMLKNFNESGSTQSRLSVPPKDVPGIKRVVRAVREGHGGWGQRKLSMAATPWLPACAALSNQTNRHALQGMLTVRQAPARWDGARHVRVLCKIQLLQPAGQHPAIGLWRRARQA